MTRHLKNALKILLVRTLCSNREKMRIFDQHEKFKYKVPTYWVLAHHKIHIVLDRFLAKLIYVHLQVCCYSNETNLASKNRFFFSQNHRMHGIEYNSMW